MSELLDNTYHDQFTRLLSNNEFTSRDLWHYVKSIVCQVECSDGVLIFDDTIQKRLFSKENALNTWHFDHTKNCTVKGIYPKDFKLLRGGKRTKSQELGLTK